MAQDLIETPELDQQDVQLASANTGVTTDGGAFVGTRLNMPKGLNTRENQAKQSVLIADTLAGGGKGAVQGFVGLPGDLESIGRMALGYLGYDVNENTVLPTSEEIGKRLESALGPVIPQGQTTGVPTEERVRAAEGGELGGEIIAPSGQIKLAGKVIKATKDLPVGMSIKAVDESLDPLGFYSAASKAVDNIQQPKGTGAQFLAQIEKTPGVKKEELLWTGLDEFLAGKKSVTKAEVQDYLNTNRVEIKETTVGNININQNSPYALPEVVKVIKDNQGSSNYSMRLSLENDYNAYNALIKKFPNLEETENWGNWGDMVLNDVIGSSGGTKFSKYTMPGGENYREILLQLDRPAELTPKPNAVEVINEKLLSRNYGALDEDQVAILNAGGTPAVQMLGNMQSRLNINFGIDDIFENNKSVFSYGHFDQPNVLAHMRLNDRVDADGKKVLFVEEVQSDWHQTGRKQGYKNPDAEKQVIDIEKRMADLANDRDPVTNQIVNERDFMALWKEKDELLKQTKGVPDAPFKTSWHELALKRAIQLASEGGYDRIAFTTGKTQAERYDLSKQISKISYEKGDNGMYDLIANDMDGTEVLFKEDIPLSEVEDIIGKDMAKKIANDEGKPGDGTGYRNWKTFRGVDLQVGGEGMKGFYDTILPKYLDKYGKKWDAKVGKTNIRLATDKQDMADSELLGELGLPKGGKAMASVHYMDITPKMKESVLTKGQPLFQMAPAIPAGVAAGQQEDNK
jgi:hypothetical protein